MLEALLEILGEFVLQVVVEALVEVGLHSVAEPFRRTPDPWLAALAYAMFGAALGALSLWPLPLHQLPPPQRLANLVLTPIAVGVLMTAFGAWRARRGEPVLRIDRFAWGYLFALAFALVRYRFAG